MTQSTPFHRVFDFHGGPPLLELGTLDEMQRPRPSIFTVQRIRSAGLLGLSGGRAQSGVGIEVSPQLARRGISRFPSKELLHMPGSSTTPGRSDLAMVRPKRVAFRARNSVGTRGLAFAAQWLAYALPYRRFVGVLTDANARLGADVDRYSFIVVDLHHLLLAGLPAHLCKNSAGYNRTRNFGLYGHAESKKTQKFVFRSTLRPNQISFSHMG